uniref:Uncharacterized protein n=1 Tax=Arundo donax TaxID=35708 RepID=A0A0A8YN61_ARUDO
MMMKCEVSFVFCMVFSLYYREFTCQKKLPKISLSRPQFLCIIAALGQVHCYTSAVS